jgi:hypothetical protein
MTLITFANSHLTFTIQNAPRTAIGKLLNDKLLKIEKCKLIINSEGVL